jgi:NhaA family Na+:H+ antiporter
VSIHKQPRDPTLQSFFEIRIETFLSPLENFIHKQTTAAILLALATILALILANSPWGSITKAVFDIEIGMVFHHWHFLLSFKEWVSSGLMALFFFLIGLEMKREVLAGRLRHPQQISLIIMAAVGGMIFPALIYWCFNYGTEGVHGWAIPMATDTAFAIGVLALLAKRVSYGISIFLTAMAIIDDIGAIIVMSLFYTHELHVGPLLSALAIIAVLLFVNIAGVRRGWIYALLGITLWVFIYNSGVHATLAGLLLAILIPARTRLGQTGFLEEVRALLAVFEIAQGERQNQGLDTRILCASGQHSLAIDIEETVKAASTPLQRWENFLINPVGIVVLPLFALCTAGVSVSLPEMTSALSSAVTQGIIAGLVIGKPLGVLLLVLLGLWLKLGKLPEGMRFSEVAVAGMLGGIGFTMSLFITTLSFENYTHMIDAAKIGIIFASIISSITACLWVFMINRFSLK